MNNSYASDEVEYYKRLLELSSAYSLHDIKKARREELSKWHPDRFISRRAKEKAESRTKEINEASDVLIALLSGKASTFEATFSSSEPTETYQEKEPRKKKRTRLKATPQRRWLPTLKRVTWFLLRFAFFLSIFILTLVFSYVRMFLQILQDQPRSDYDYPPRGPDMFGGSW
jgi:DnaJ domain